MIECLPVFMLSKYGSTLASASDIIDTVETCSYSTSNPSPPRFWSYIILFDGESQEVTRTLSSADIRHAGWVAGICLVGVAFEFVSQPRLAAYASSS